IFSNISFRRKRKQPSRLTRWACMIIRRLPVRMVGKLDTGELRCRIRSTSRWRVIQEQSGNW
ncbi:MAG TPA: hypothetical protein VJ252_01785, partial [Chthoniobacterales bacterium]|nr:hypothetical protein [Chthoniobacterales bacterium]